MPDVTVNGWRLYAHPLFVDQLERLIREVALRQDADPEHYRQKNCTKRLAAILRLITVDIPADPGHPKFRQGDTLGDARKHWFRAKFFQQYRLFYRFDSRAKVIVFAWVNDDASLRAYGSGTDAYTVFSKMRGAGNPSDDFPALLSAAEAASGQTATILRAASDLS